GGGQAQARRGNHGARAGARTAGELSHRRLVGRDRRDAARLALAHPARPGDGDLLRPPAPPPLDGLLLRPQRDRARPARLARRGATGERGLAVEDYVAGGVPEGLVPRTTDARNA